MNRLPISLGSVRNYNLIAVIVAAPIMFTAPIIAAAQQQREPTSHAREKKGAEQQQLITSIQGADLYHAYCASCHGLNGKGDGPVAPALKTRPADLTRIAMRNGGTFPLMRVARVIAGEEPSLTGHGSMEMPVWGPIFSKVTNDVDLGHVRIDNLARYIRDMQVK